jgi:hypothetical protein
MPTTSHARASVAFALAAVACGCATGRPGDAARQHPEPPPFPAAWVGSWRGTITTHGGAGPMEVSMTLDIAPEAEPGRWAWTITYEGPAGKQVRAYRLLARDEPKGSFAIDERNGIVLPARWVAGTLYASFEVQGSRVDVREELVGAGTPDAAIAVEMATVRVDTGESTGGTPGPGGAGIPAVRGWAPSSVQRGLLRPAVAR